MKLDESVTWAVTCMDDRKLRLMLRYLPEEPFDWLLEMVVITHRDEPDNALRCRKVAEHWRPEWPIRVRSDEVEKNALDFIDAPKALRVYFDDLLGVKLMIPLTVDAPFLFTDDDVIVQGDPGTYLDDRFWGSHSGLDGYTDTKKDLEALNTLNKVFFSEFSLKEFNRERTDAGVWYFPANHQDYEMYLRDYFTSKHIIGVSQDTGVANGHTQRFRKLDQRFLSGFIMAHEGYGARAPIYRAMADKKIPRKVPSTVSFLHYCASGQKERYMEWLQRGLNDR